MMMDNTIEIMGQKFSYPSTWQGATSVFVVCSCIAFLAWTLEASEIDSYQGLFNGASEQAYNESLSTISELNAQIEGMQLTINDLSEKANLVEEEKEAVLARLETERQSRERALVSLSHLQAARVSDLNRNQKQLPVQQQQQQQQYLSLQDQQIQQQLGNIQQQQQQQLQLQK